MKLEELQSKINAISLGSNPHSPLNSQILENLFCKKRRLLSEEEYGVNLDTRVKPGHNNYA